MHSTKNYVIVFLALTTVAGAALVWRQYQELIALRAAAMNNEADWQKRLSLADHQRNALESKVASLQKTSADESPTDDASAPPNRGWRGNRGAFRELMNRPEIQKLMAVREKAALDSRYSALFKNLALTPQQLDQFKNLLVEKRTAMMDVLSAARDQGVSPRTDPEAFQKLVGDAQSGIDDNIRSLLGDAGFQQYQTYEQTLPERNVVDQLQQRLSYTSTPLTDDQVNQMIQLLATNAPQRSSGSSNPVAAVFGPGGGGGGTHINQTDLTQATGVLAAPQLDALQQLQQEQQAQAALRDAMRAQFQTGGAAGSAPATSGGTNASPASPGGGG